MICCGTRKSSFVFENGTTVIARDYPSAIVKLHETDLKHFTLNKIGECKWNCEFSNGVNVEFESPSEHMARLYGPWFLYLDKRLKDELPLTVGRV
jgi:hypothetical protein